MKTGTLGWLKKSLKEKWERTRRNLEYIEFCETHPEVFDGNGILDPFTSLTPEAEAIMNRFGLEMIYHPSIDISEDQILEWPVFKEPLAVKYEWREEEPDHFTPIWDDHYIKLKIDINPERNLGQITDEVKEFVTSARAVLEIDENKEGNSEERIHSHKRMDYYRIWDERKAKKPFSVIAQEMGITEDTAKKRFYKAYELITEMPYDREQFARVPIFKSELRKTCENCPDKECLKGLEDPNYTWTPCPEVAYYIQQDEVKKGKELQADYRLLYSEDRDED